MLQSFKSFIEEETIDNYGGKKLIATTHFKGRQKERNATDTEVKDIFRKATDHLKRNDYGDQEKFLFYSKKHDRAIAFAHKQINSKDKRKHLIATTVFPKGDSYANANTSKVEVESYSTQFTNYINSFISEDCRTAEPLSEVIFEGVEFYFLRGELDNTPFYECVTVE